MMRTEKKGAIMKNTDSEAPGDSMEKSKGNVGVTKMTLFLAISTQ